MLNNLRLYFFLFLCFSLVQPLFAFDTGLGDLDQELKFQDFPETESMISMDLKDASLKDILKVFSIQSGLNFIASESVKDRKVTLYLNNVPLKEAMDKFFKANNLTYDVDKDSDILIVKDWGKPEVETITKVFRLKYASVSSSSLELEKKEYIKSSGGTVKDAQLTSIVERSLSEFGKVTEDKRTNSLIVTELPNRMPLIEQLIQAMDIAQPQVMLEVEMLDVNKNLTDAMGFKFNSSPITLTLSGSTVPIGFPFGDWGKSFYNLGTTTSEFNNKGSLAISSGYEMMVDFLKTQSDTKSLARPRILTLSNETAEIKITTNETIGVTEESSTTSGSTATSSGKPERTETGVTLRVTPQVNLETGNITMVVIPIVKDTSTSSFTISGNDNQFFKDPEERSTKSVVMVKDGETIIIGGLLRNELVEERTAVPFLSDIPILGVFFRHKNKTKDRERELLVFITPHIINESRTELAQAKNTFIPDREQNTASVLDRHTAINSLLNSFEKKKK